MSGRVTGPFALVPTQATILTYPEDAAPQAAVVIDNLSPYTLQVTIGTQQYWLPPFQENIYALPESRQPVAVVPSTVGAPGLGAALTVVQATWYAPGDKPPGGTWPMALTGPAVEATIASQGLFGQQGSSLKSAKAIIGSGAAHVFLPVATGVSYRLWNWGATDTSTGGSGVAELALARPHTTPTTPFTGTTVADSISYPNSPASNRISGILAQGVSITSLVNPGTTAFFVLYTEV